MSLPLMVFFAHVRYRPVRRRLLLLQAALLASCAVAFAATADSAFAATSSLSSRVLTIDLGGDSSQSPRIQPSGANLVITDVISGPTSVAATDVDTIRFIADDPAGTGNVVQVGVSSSTLTIGTSIRNETAFPMEVYGSLTMTGGGLTSSGAVTFHTDVTLTTGGDSSFESTARGVGGASGRALNFTGSGTVTFQGDVTNLSTYTSDITTAFGGTGAVSMTSSGAQTFTGGITNAAGHSATTLTASSISSAGTITSAAASTLTLTATSDITLAGQVTGALRIVKAGTNTLTIARANTTTGGFGINEGTLVITNGGALGTGPITMLPVTTLTLSGGIELTGPTGLTVSGSSGFNPTIRSIGGTNRLSVPITLSSAKGIDLGATGDTSPFVLNASLTGSGTSASGQAVTLRGGAMSILQPITAVNSVTVFTATSLSANITTESQTYYATASLMTDVTLSTGGFFGGSDIINGTGSRKTLTLDFQNHSANTPTYTGLIGGQSNGTSAEKDLNLVVTGNSIFPLGGGNTYTGTTTISGSDLIAYAANSLSTGAVTVNGTGTLSLRTGVGLTGVPSITISGPGRGVWKGALHAMSATGADGNVVVTQPITLAGDATIGGDPNVNLVIEGGITGASHVLSTTGWTKLHSAVTGLSGLTNTSNAYETWLDRSITTTGAMSFTRSVYLENSLTLAASGLTGTGEFRNATGSSKTLTISTSGDSDFAGRFAASTATNAQRTLDLVKTGAGRLTLSGSTSAPIGTATISAGSLVVSGSLIPTADIIVSSGTTLFGSGGNLSDIVLGTDGAPTPSTGTLDLGRDATPRRINATSFTGTSAGALKLELAGPDVIYSQMIVTGLVDLNDTMLYATIGATPQPGDRYTIIDNTGNNPISGTFLGVAEGGRAVLGAHQFIVSYFGGDGNDVTLTYFGAAPTITASSPATGPSTGGTPVTITGTGFGPGAIVTIGGVPCTGVAVAADHTSLTCTTGAHAAGAAIISVTNIDGQAGTLLNGYTFADPPPPPAPAPTPTATPTASPTTAPVIAKPSFNASGGSVSVVVNATGLGTATLRVVASGRLRVATGCTAKKAVKTAGRVTLSCKLPAAVRSAIKRAAVKLTVTTTWAPKSGTPTRTVAAITAKR